MVRLIFVLAACAPLLLHGQESTEPPAAAKDGSLEALGYSVTSGAAPGYVEDRACAMCHAEIYGSYQKTGMARSFVKPAAHHVIEDFQKARGAHPASKRHYEMAFEKGEYKFRRYQSGEEGTRLNVFEQTVDWILGSGDHARTYLYQTESGEMYQLPIAYYPQEKIWYMAPGFDRPNHQGIGQRVSRECMFCHNAYPDVPEGSDAYGTRPLFPEKLPEGIGCQRCHGPGADHVRVALHAGSGVDQKRAAIVNPARLEPRLRDDICYQCHMQPSARMPGLRRFGRNDYSFRAGDALADYLVQLDPVEEGKDRSERFEINHHPYRLEQSRCFQESDGALSCATCHDPHRTVPAAQRTEHYREACQGCHKPEAYAAAHAAEEPPVEGEDCASCHMPQRRAEDVVHVVMTDHFIAARQGGDDLLAPLKEFRPAITDFEIIDPEQVPDAQDQYIYRAVAVLRASSGTDAAATERLEALLTGTTVEQVEPYLDLVRGQLKQRRFEAAEQTARAILKRVPRNHQAREWLGLSLLARRKLDEAMEEFRGLLKEEPARPEANYNLGLLYIGKDQYADAVVQFETAVKARPNMGPAWYYLGYANSKLNRLNDAFYSYRRTLQIEPSHPRAYVGIGQTLIQQGNRDEAIRYYRHGLKVASRLAPIAKAMDEALASQ